MHKMDYRKIASIISSLSPRLVIRYVLLSSIVLLAVLLGQPSPKSPLTAPSLSVGAEPVSIDPVNFRNVTLDWNLAVTHQQSSKYLTTITETLGSGVCVIDVNNDGWMDLFFVGGQGHTRPYGKASWWSKASGNRLLLNKQGHHFEDITETSGVNDSIWGMACAVGDLNNDGFTDLIVTGVGTNQLFKNEGDMTFTNVISNSGIINDSWSTGASLADFNGDGLLDFYLSNYIRFKKGAKTFERDRGFRTTINIAFDQTLYDPEPNRLYLNKGNFHFEDVAKNMGVADSFGRSLGAKWFDFNKDTWLDLLVINDHGTPNQVYINQKGKGFSRDIKQHSIFEAAGAHDIVVGDFDNDMLSEFYMTSGMGNSPIFLSPDDQGVASFDSKKTNYIDTSWHKGLAKAESLSFSGWASTAADFNNDGFLDLYVANGIIRPDTDSHFVSQAQHNSLFVNTQRGSFSEQFPTVDKEYPYSSRGVVSVDLDNDGYLEVVLSNNNDALLIYKNETRVNNWIGLDFSASQEADIYGSQIVVQTNNQKIYRTLQTSQQFLSQGDSRLHVGLGKNKKIMSFSIKWKDGSVSEFENIDVNKYYVVNKEADTLSISNYNTNTYTHFDGALSGANDEVLIKLAGLLINNVEPINNRDDLAYIWQLASSNARNSILDHITEHWHQKNIHKEIPPYLSIVKQALTDQDSSIRVRAINIFSSMELEASIRWLIPRLNDENAEVQCAAAKTFGFFFDEEEAVTHRKMLALSPLIKLLGTNNSEVAICAADALAVAESKRAVIPLMERVRKYKNSEVATASIRALGLIGDTKAISLIRELINDPASDGSVIGAGLIALMRLDSSIAVKDYASYFDRDQESFNFQHKYEALTYLFLSTDGVVFPRIELERELSKLIKLARSAKNKGLKLNKKITLAKLKAIGASRSSLYEKEVVSIVTSSDQSFKKEALITLGLLDGVFSGEKFAIHFIQQSSDYKKYIVEGITRSKPFGGNLIEGILKRKNSFDTVLLLLQALPPQDASKLLNSLLIQSLGNKQYLSLLNACTTLNLKPSYRNRFFKNDVVSELSLHALDCFLQAESDSSEYNIKTYSMIRTLMADESIDSDIKTRLLIKASKKNRVIGYEVLAKRLDSLHDKWQLPALEALADVDGVAGIEDSLWKLYKNTQGAWSVRLQAALLLINSGGEFKHNRKSLKENTELSELGEGSFEINKTEVINYLYANFAM